MECVYSMICEDIWQELEKSIDIGKKYMWVCVCVSRVCVTIGLLSKTFKPKNICMPQGEQFVMSERLRLTLQKNILWKIYLTNASSTRTQIFFKTVFFLPRLKKKSPVHTNIVCPFTWNR